MAKAQPAYYYKGKRMKRLPAGTCITKGSMEQGGTDSTLVQRKSVMGYCLCRI